MADVQDAIEFLRHANDAESENRQLGLQALQFRYGDQWPQYAVASRGLERPQLTINETNTYIKKVTNAQRQQRPRGKASPVDSFADPKVAKTITGLGRHVEVNSDADYCYDTAFDFAATIGWGYFGLRTDFVSDESFDQDIYFRPFENPFNVYFDYNSRLPDGSDAEEALVTDKMAKTAFEKKHPGAQMSSFSDRGTGDSDPDWVTERDIRIAEYFKIERTKHKLVMLSDGTATWADRLPPKELLTQAGIVIVGDRESQRKIVKWRKQTGFEILEEKTLPGKWIPIIPVYWTNVIIDSRRMKFGLVKDAMDPARMNNFWWTAITESLALAPKAKWVGPEGFNETNPSAWNRANVDPGPVLTFKTTGLDGQPIPPPERVQPESPPTGMIEAAFMAKQNLSAVMGVFDPAVRDGAQHKSDKTLNAERSQSENTNFDGYDNLTRSIKHGWRIMLGWFPTVYDTQRAMRIIGEDGREKIVNINEKTQAPHPQDPSQAVEKVLNDVCVGTYDVVMETGPGYDTRRQEGVAAMMELLGTALGEKVAATSDDLVLRSMDFPGSDLIADRMAAANPLAQIDEQSEIPPAVQMKMKSMEQVIQQLQEKLNQAALEIKTRSGVEEIRQHGALLVEKMRQDGDAKERDITARAKQHDAETYALTAQNVAEINGLVKLLTSKTEHGNRLREMLLEFEHAVQLQERQLEVKAETPEPSTIQ